VQHLLHCVLDVFFSPFETSSGPLQQSMLDRTALPFNRCCVHGGAAVCCFTVLVVPSLACAGRAQTLLLFGNIQSAAVPTAFCSLQVHAEFAL
jgi:hypothetical protein